MKAQNMLKISRRARRLTVVTLGAIALTLSSSLLDPGVEARKTRADETTKGSTYKLERGPFKIMTITEVNLKDARRQKELRLRINHPDGKGPFPVIIYSHGAGGSKDEMLALTEHWASHGYITIQPDHSDSVPISEFKIGARPDLSDWQNRPADISFIIDSLEELKKKDPALKGKLNAKRIGVSGNSFGAHTTQLIGGAKVFVAGAERSFRDKRVTAVIPMSPQGPGEALTEKSWEEFATPMLVMTGSRDGTRTGQPPEWRKKPYELSPKGDKYLIWVEGLDHGFGGIGGRPVRGGSPNEDHIQYTKMATVAFWDTYLKDSKEARAYLESDKLPAFSKGTLKLERK